MQRYTQKLILCERQKQQTVLFSLLFLLWKKRKKQQESANMIYYSTNTVEVLKLLSFSCQCYFKGRMYD